MTDATTEYEKLLALFSDTDGVLAGQMFGKACLKIHGKAFLARHKDWIVFKLDGAEHAKAIAIDGAVLWDPSGTGRAMKAWVAIPARESRHFAALAKVALGLVGAN